MVSFQQLYGVLQAEHRTASALLAILETEREALIHSDPEQMAKLTADKQPLVVQLEQLSRQRAAILQAEGFPSDKAGLAAYIANQPPQQAEQLNVIMAALKQVAAACQRHNQINGGIVNVNRQYLHRAMSILRGKDMEVTAYGPGGEYTNQIVRQPLIGRV